MSAPTEPDALAAPVAFAARPASGLLVTARRLWPYLWPPPERADLRLRIYIATALILVAKFVTVLMPYSFKWATDALVADTQAHASAWRR